MKKLIKFIVWTIVSLVLLVILLAATLPLWIGSVVTGGVNAYGPSYTKTGVHLGQFALNPYKGTLSTGDFQLDNPSGYSPKQMCTLGSLAVEWEAGSVLSDVIHIKSIRVKDVFVSYAFKKDMKSNFDCLAENMDSGEAEKRETAKTETAKTEAKSAQAKSQKRVIIDRVEIEGVLLQVGPLSVPLTPKPIVLTDIGKETGGILPDEAYEKVVGPIQEVAEPVMKTAKSINVKDLDSAIDAVKSLKDAGKNSAGKGNEAIKNTRKQLKNIGKDLESFFK